MTDYTEFHLLSTLADALSALDSVAEGRGAVATRAGELAVKVRADHPHAAARAMRFAELEHAAAAAGWPTKERARAYGAMLLGVTPEQIATGLVVELKAGRWCAVALDGRVKMGPPA